MSKAVAMPTERTHRCIQSTVRFFAKKFPFTDIRVLDVGARDGYATFLLERLGYTAIATDIDEGFVSLAKRRYMVTAFRDDFTETKIPSTFNAVFARHVMEHLPTADVFFASCRKVLVGGGHVFLTIPLEKRLRKGDVHLCNFPTPGDFLATAGRSQVIPVEYGMSEDVGIIPTGREFYFIGRMAVK